MNRILTLSFALLVGACARQPICKPWSPTTAASAAPAAAPDDGTVAVAAASPDETWTSVVGEGAIASADANDASRAAGPAPGPHRHAKPATRPADEHAGHVAATKPAASPADKPAKPAANPLLPDAKKFYAGRCVPCHGASGKGDGPTGVALTPKPRNFTDRSWQRTVTDLHIEKAILQGGPAVGKSPLMPPHGDLSGKPELLAAMREVVRGFGR